MYAIVSVVSFVLLLMVLVGIHECGHFLSARAFGITVSEFGFGFPPRLWSRRRGETVYSINAIPLGGFVRMEGENGDSESPTSFGAKRAWQRAVVLGAGAVMNLVGALVLFFLVYTIAPVPQDVPIVAMVQPHSPAAAALELGDRIEAVNGVEVDSQTAAEEQIACSLGRHTVLTIDRAGHTIERTVVPRVHPGPNQGHVGFLGSIVWTGTDGWSALKNSLGQPGEFARSVWRQITVQRCNALGVTGPVGIARVTGSAANAVPELGAGPVLYITALVSLNLAIVNLLPIPALDGGRLLFVLIGVVRRKRVSPLREGMAHVIGMALLLTLVLIVSARDVGQWLSGS
jgi:regulator of sigma E protease